MALLVTLLLSFSFIFAAIGGMSVWELSNAWLGAAAFVLLNVATAIGAVFALRRIID